MGTLNFQTGDIFTLGLNLDEITMDDVVEWMGYKSIKSALRDYDYEELEYIVENEKQTYMEDVYAYCKEEIDKLKQEISDKYLNVVLQYGYYESFEIMVNKNYFTNKEIDNYKRTCSTPSFIWDMEVLTDEEKEEIKNELNIVREFLKKMVSRYLHVCYPSWTGGWVDVREVEFKYIDEHIDEAIKAL